MSIVQTAFDEVGVKVVADALPKEQRTVKVFQRLIAAMRAAEAAVQDQLNEMMDGMRKSQEQRFELQERVHKLEGELLRNRIKDHVNGPDALTVGDRTKLLEISAVS